MKIGPKQYARALSEAAVGASEKEARIYTDRFLEIMKKNNDLKKLPKIVLEAEKIKEDESGVKKVKIISAIELSSETKKEIVSKLKDIFKTKIELLEKIEPDILGGMIIEIGNEVLDASVRSKINLFKQILSSL